jgi:hypothetical protein
LRHYRATVARLEIALAKAAAERSLRHEAATVAAADDMECWLRAANQVRRTNQSRFVPLPNPVSDVQACVGKATRGWRQSTA